MFGRKPDPSQDSDLSPLQAKLAEGMQIALQQVPPQYRAMARTFLPHLLTSLRSASDKQLREGLTQVRNGIDNLLGEEG